ncbi:hypothetical protein CVT30_13215 [Streptomyces sp. AMCC400023]|nr:hypothetical protein CVT30_13215 [Streptomyces sp. AMCC400023]
MGAGRAVPRAPEKQGLRPTLFPEGPKAPSGARGTAREAPPDGRLGVEGAQPLGGGTSRSSEAESGGGTGRGGGGAQRTATLKR